MLYIGYTLSIDDIPSCQARSCKYFALVHPRNLLESCIAADAQCLSLDRYFLLSQSKRCMHQKIVYIKMQKCSL